MKKILPIVVFVVFMVSGFSQQTTVPVNEARSLDVSGLMHVTDIIGDFTITDSDGATWNLYEQLDAGKTVFLDLFYTT